MYLVSHCCHLFYIIRIHNNLKKKLFFMLEFKINDFITLKLENGLTNIYIKDKKFEFYCDRLVVVIQSDNLSNFDDLESIDDLNQDQSSLNVSISPKEEFWGHCSNLQSWEENEYNTALLHSSLSFPLLKKLTEVGDPIANKFFKNEIGKRFVSKNPNTSKFLVEEDYLNFLNDEEFASLMESYKEYVKQTEIEQIDVYEILGLSYFSRCFKYFKKQGLTKLNAFFQPAKDFFEKALEIAPNNYSAWNNFGYALKRLGKYGEAIEKFKGAIAINPNNEAAWNHFGLALLSLGNYERAIEKFKGAIVINPNNDSAWNNFGYALNRLGKYGEAIEKFKEAIAINPNNEATWKNFGDSLLSLGNYERAIEKYKEAIAINPNNDSAWHNFGYALNRLGKYGEAFKKYQNALAIDPNNDIARKNLGNILRKLGRHIS